MTIIRDGSGSGFEARVTSSNRLSVSSSTSSSFAVVSGETQGAFSACAQQNISLTAASGESGVLYVAPAEIPFALGAFAVGSDVSGVWRAYAAPTGGTLISSGTAVNAVNLNLGSGRVFGGTVLRGADGLTVTGGAVMFYGEVAAGFNTLDTAGALIVPPGTSVALTFVPSVNAVVQAQALIGLLEG
jgi:hypothetical protein